MFGRAVALNRRKKVEEEKMSSVGDGSQCDGRAVGLNIWSKEESYP